MGEEKGRREGLGQEVRRQFRRGDINQGGNSIRDEATDVVVADKDMSGFARYLGGLRELDCRAVVLTNGGGVRLGEAIGIEEVPEMRNPAAATGEADIFCFHAGKGDAGMLSRGEA